jgi:hypothetical protein
MAKNKGRPENLIPLTTEKAREIGSKGGRASVEARRKNKVFAGIYTEMLAAEYKVKKDGTESTVKGTEFVKIIAADVLERRDATSVSMLESMRKAIDGDEVHADVDVKAEVYSFEQKKKRLNELLGVEDKG